MRSVISYSDAYWYTIFRFLVVTWEVCDLPDFLPCYFLMLFNICTHNGCSWNFHWSSFMRCCICVSKNVVCFATLICYVSFLVILFWVLVQLLLFPFFVFSNFVFRDLMSVCDVVSFVSSCLISFDNITVVAMNLYNTLR